MDTGISTTVSSQTTDVAALAQRAERVGFESFWLPEHPVIPVNTDSRYGGTPDGSIPAFMNDLGDPLIGLAMASVSTHKIKLGTAVSLVPEHNPLLQAKQIATLDLLSGGRFIFGIGAGWLKEETEIMGGDFEHRWSQTREAVSAMKELWTKDEAEFHGRFYDFPPVRCSPKPVQKPHPPVLLGGFAPNVFKRIAAWGDGWMPIRVTPEQVKMGRATLDELANAAGRDPKSLSVTVAGAPADRDSISRLEEAGADRVIVAMPREAGADALSAIDQLAEKVFLR